MKNKHSLLVTCLLCHALGLLAQNGSINGRILDQVDNQPIEYASIAVFLANDSSLINGVVSDEQGLFVVKNLPETQIYISVQFMGYETYYSESFLLGGAC